MPKELEHKLMHEATMNGMKPGGKAWSAYVYGILRKTGWKPKRRR